MEKILTEQERAEAFNKILNKENKYSHDEISLYIKGLSELERAGVLKYAEDKKEGAMDFVNRFRELNPNNREYPYTNNYQFNDAITVIARIEIQSTPEQEKQTETIKPVKGLKINQIALIHAYKGIQITRENAAEIAAKHDYTAKYSGEGLFQDYEFYCSRANRTAKPFPESRKKLINKISLFESIVNYLSDSAKSLATDEITILKTKLETDFQ
jgi:hypothetical protein